MLLVKYPKHDVISDIGSGINFKRPGLHTILEQSSHGMVQEVVVSHRDRLVSLHMTSSNTFLNSMVQNSWFSRKMAPPMMKQNSVKISLPSIPSLSAGCKESEQQDIDENEKHNNKRKCKKPLKKTTCCLKHQKKSDLT
jgi:hypothetical protein